MNRTLSIVALAAIACAGCRRDTAAKTETTAEVVPAADITVVGCVQPAERAPAGAVGAPGSGDSTYVLTDAHQSNSGGSTGTSGSSTAAPGSTYRLDASDATLAPAVGHEVEIVAATPEPDSSGRAPKIKVATIKMVAVPCP
jgi:hypothetical protein